VVKTTLVDRDIEDGIRLIEALDKIHFRIQAALWLYNPESFWWRLIIATPLVDERGPRYTYTNVQGGMKSITPPLSISLQDVSVISPTDNLVKLLSKAIRIPSGLSGVRFTRNTINSTYIEDAYIYRINSIAKSPAA
jgi:hypothetical protein